MKEINFKYPKISIIIATIGRIVELDRLLNSIVNNTYKNTEVIIVDQNKEGYLNSVLNKYLNKFKIKHILSNKRGVSINKNIGYKYSEGSIITFSDDDSYYDTDTIERAILLLENFDAISGRPWCPLINQKSLIRSPDKEVKINSFNYFNATIEFAMFWKKTTLEKIGFWDEMLGVGGRWGSEGGADLVTRALKKGCIIQYFPKLIIYHENQLRKDKDKIYSYSKGHGAFMAKSIYKESNWRFFPYSFTIIVASSLKIFYFFITNRIQDMKVYQNRIKGIWQGFFEYRFFIKKK